MRSTTKTEKELVEALRAQIMEELREDLDCVRPADREEVLEAIEEVKDLEDERELLAWTQDRLTQPPEEAMYLVLLAWFDDQIPPVLKNVLNQIP